MYFQNNVCILNDTCALNKKKIFGKRKSKTESIENIEKTVCGYQI